MTQLYRKSALERLSSPDQLDKALKLSSPMSWLVLIGLTLIIVVTIIWSIVGSIPVTLTAIGIISSPRSTNTIYADEPGTIRAIYVNPNENITFGDTILLFQSGMENKQVISDQVGSISEILVKNGDVIVAGSEIARISPKITYKEADVVVCYVPLEQKNKISRGMEVQIYLDGPDSQSKGHMTARVINIDSRATTNAGMISVLGNDNNIAAKIQNSIQGPVVAVTCELYAEDYKGQTSSGYYWTNEKGYDVLVPTGSSVTAKIVTEEMAPIEKLFSKVKEIWGE